MAEQKENFMIKTLEKVKERGFIAVCTILLTFGLIFRTLSDGKITVEEMGLVTAVTNLATFVYGFYFGTSKNETDRQRVEREKKPSEKSE